MSPVSGAIQTGLTYRVGAPPPCRDLVVRLSGSQWHRERRADRRDRGAGDDHDLVRGHANARPHAHANPETDSQAHPEAHAQAHPEANPGPDAPADPDTGPNPVARRNASADTDRGADASEWSIGDSVERGERGTVDGGGVRLVRPGGTLPRRPLATEWRRHDRAGRANRPRANPLPAPFAPPFDVETILPVLIWALTSSAGVLFFGVLVRNPAAADASLSIFAVSRDRRRRRSSVSAAVEASSPVPGSDAVQPGPIDPDLDDAGPRVPRSSRPPLRFAKPPAKGVERRVIGYRRVRVSAGPDDLTPQVDRIDRGDEVELIGETEGFLRIRTPQGIEGWVPRVVILGPPTSLPA